METIPLLQTELGVLLLIFITVLVLGLVFGIATQNKLNKLNDNEDTLNKERVQLGVIKEGAQSGNHVDPELPAVYDFVKLYNSKGHAYENTYVKGTCEVSAINPAGATADGWTGFTDNLTIVVTNDPNNFSSFYFVHTIDSGAETEVFKYVASDAPEPSYTYNFNYELPAWTKNFTHVGMIYTGNGEGDADNQLPGNTSITVCGIDQNK